jgi:hypothetical protein
MKRMFCVVSAVTLLTAGVVYAEVDKPVAEQSQPKQEQQGTQGAASGQQERAANEQAKPKEQDKKVTEKAKADEMKKKKEWAEIGAPHNRVTHHNARAKRDRAGRHR